MIRRDDRTAASLRSTAVLVAAWLLAGCAGPLAEASESPPVSLPPTASTSLSTVTPEPSTPVPSLVPSPTPSNESYEDEASAIIRELSASDCQLFGTGDFGLIDVTVYADAITELPDRTGWLDEPFLWVGSVEKLTAARDASLVGEAEHGTWIVFTDDAGQPRAESYWAFPNTAGDVIWFAKDSIAPEPCPPDL